MFIGGHDIVKKCPLYSKVAEEVLIIARKQFKRRRKAYYEVSIFSVEDLYNTLICDLLEDSCEEALLRKAYNKAEAIARRGRYRQQFGATISIESIAYKL